MAEKKDQDQQSTETPPAEPKPTGADARLSPKELRERLAALEAPRPEAPPVWTPPRPEDLVFAEVGPRHQAVDDVTRETKGPGQRGYFQKDLLARHPEGFLEVGADGRLKGAFPTLRMSSRLETGPAVHTPEPLLPQPMEGAPAA